MGDTVRRPLNMGWWRQSLRPSFSGTDLLPEEDAATAYGLGYLRSTYAVEFCPPMGNTATHPKLRRFPITGTGTTLVKRHWVSFYGAI